MRCCVAVNYAATFLRRHTARRRAWAVRTALIVALVLAAALGAPGAVLAHDINTPAGHEAEDSVVHSAASEAVLDNGTRLRSAWASLATAEAVADDPGQVGAMGPSSRLARRRHSCGAASERQSARLGLRRRCRDRGVSRSQLHESHRLRPHHGHPYTRHRRSGVQHFLRRFRAPLRRFVVHRRRQQERALEGIVQTHLFNPGPTAGASVPIWRPVAGIRPSRR